MGLLSRRARVVGGVLAAVLLALAPPASGHVEEKAGGFVVTVGWGDEPPLSGSRNFVDVEVSDESGAPVRVRSGALDVEVSFGGETKTLALVPSGEPGHLRATIVPTRPGTYSFHVRGNIDGAAVDTEAACSERTFECVTDAAGVQFPARDPSSGALAQRLVREEARADRAADRADGARSLAVVALVVAGLALAAAVALAIRGRQKST